MEASELLVSQIYRDLSSEIRGSYLDEEDIKQEIRFALLVTSSVSQVKQHLRRVLRTTQRPITEESRSNLTWILLALTERCNPVQKIVLQLKYGLLDGKVYSDRNIAKRFKLSERSILEIETDAIKTIQSSPGIAYLQRKFLRIR